MKLGYFDELCIILELDKNRKSNKWRLYSRRDAS